jgi:hypothetical protein
MRVVLHELSKRSDGVFQLRMSFGDEPEKLFIASYDGADPKYKYCSMDQELFMRLSDLAHQRFGNCAVYQMELVGIIAAFAMDNGAPVSPVTLGKSTFCTLKPGMMRVVWNKLWIVVNRMRHWTSRWTRQQVN